MCLLEDANSVQIALMQVLSLLGSGQIEHKEAGLMLYGLQTASMNLKHTTFEAAEVTDVVIDRDTVNATRIGGQQWFEEDFETVEEDVIEQEDSAEQEDNEEQNNAEQNNIEQGSEEQHNEAGDEATDEDAAVSEPVMAATALHASVEAPRASRTPISAAEARRTVQGLIRSWMLETAAEKARVHSG
jgi:hypothetical protein